MKGLAYVVLYLICLTIIHQSTCTTIQVIREEYECRYGHNQVRSLYQVKDLQWDSDLALEAEQWAIHLATTNNGMFHSTFVDNDGDKYGENIYWCNGGDSKSCHDAIYLWYQEYSQYDYEQPDNIASSGHFIQLVWDDTIRVGVGIAYSDHQTWIVARYSPAEDGTASDHVKPAGSSNSFTSSSQLIPPDNSPPYIFEIEVADSSEGTSALCTDQSSSCAEWAKDGYCDDPKYVVYETCPESCGTCAATPPVDGGWTDWEQSSDCSVTCGGGYYTMTRYCINPYPSNGGSQCIGESTKTVSCNLAECSTGNVCSDAHDDCEAYKDFGYCTSKTYQTWMEVNCKASCGMCDDSA